MMIFILHFLTFQKHEIMWVIEPFWSLIPIINNSIDALKNSNNALNNYVVLNSLQVLLKRFYSIASGSL